MIDLSTLYPDLGELIDAQLADLATLPVGQLGEACEELCVFLRTAAVGALLLELDSDRFYHSLTRSGLTRVHLLEKTPPEAKQESRYCKVTSANGFYDAVAAGRFDVAERIAALSPPKWNRTYEYEDDYCYVRFLHEAVRGAGRSVMVEILHRFQEVLEGEGSVRFDVLGALLDADTDGFDGAFAALLDQRTHDIEFEKRSISRNEVEFAAGRFVFVEGLALLRIADKTGIKTQEEYPYCPREARVAMMLPFPGDGYPK